MKIALIGAAAVPPQRSQHLFWHKRSSRTPAVASSSILTPTVKISGREIRTPMAVTGGMGTRSRPSSNRTATMTGRSRTTKVKLRAAPAHFANIDLP